jgi:hypothetical protein
MTGAHIGRSLIAILAIVAASGCRTRPPTIAHVHMGHAITAVHVTPDQRGYFTEAELRAKQAQEFADQAESAADLAAAKAAVARVVDATTNDDSFGLRPSLLMAVNHISFAATSPDASLNLQEWAPVFAVEATRVLERCELIALLGKDVAASGKMSEAKILIAEIQKLADANLHGDDSNGDGRRGSVAAEYGIMQLRARLDRIVADEVPAYQPVDRWYLFNLVRLPNGRWVFDKFSRGGQIEGYK